MEYELRKVNPEDFPTGKKGAKQKYPWNALEIGEYFTVDHKYSQNIRMLASYHNRKRRSQGKRFSCQAWPEGIRVIRTH